MALKITRGVQSSPARVVLYGTEGIGKSTLASQFPKALVLDTEDGTCRLDVARVQCPDWVTLEAAILELGRDSQGFQSIVIDSADWMERAIIESILRKGNKRSIEDFGFGKGYTILAEHVARVLASADGLVAAGLNVVFVAHSKVQRTSPPDETDGYDRYELKLTKQVSPLLREWADALLFCNYRTKLVEGSDGRMKAQGGKERVMYAERAAAWDAKNRFGLPAEMPMTIESLAPLFQHTAGALPASGEAGRKVEPARSSSAKRSWRDRVAAAATLQELGDIGDEADAAVSDGKLTAEQREQLDRVIDARQAEIEAGTEVTA